jgi:ClpX C4-type zinc finger
MLCFEVQLNGKKKLLAGYENVSELGLSIETLEEEGFLEVNAGIWNETSPAEYLFWDSFDLKIGDEVTIKLLDSNNPDPPTRISQDPEVPENAKTPRTQRQMLCSSCKKSFRDVDNIIKMPGVILCNECIELIKDFESECEDEK